MLRAKEPCNPARLLDRCDREAFCVPGQIRLHARAKACAIAARQLEMRTIAECGLAHHRAELARLCACSWLYWRCEKGGRLWCLVSAGKHLHVFGGDL